MGRLTFPLPALPRLGLILDTLSKVCVDQSYKGASFEKSPLFGALDRTSAENAYKTELWLAGSLV